MSTITFSCHACGQPLQVAVENAGRRAKCTRCGTILIIPSAGSAPAPAEPAPEPQRPTRGDFDFTAEDDFQSRRGRRPHYDSERDYPYEPERPYPDEYDDGRPIGGGLRWLRIGLLLNFCAACTAAGAALLQLVAYLVFTLAVGTFLGRMPPGDAFRTILILAAVVELCGWITAIVGYVFVLLGPDRRGTRGLAIAALAVGGLHLLLNLAVKIPEYFRAGIFSVATPRGPEIEFSAAFVVLWLFIHLLYVAELILFLLVLRSIALAAGRRRVAARTSTNIFLLSPFGGIRGHRLHLLLHCGTAVARPFHPPAPAQHASRRHDLGSRGLHVAGHHHVRALHHQLHPAHLDVRQLVGRG